MADTVELSTLGAPIKEAYEGQPDTNAFTDADKEKLDEIAEMATRNSPDSHLLNRYNHTGLQLAESISDLPGLLAVKVDKVAGKQLSDENFTTEEKEGLDKLLAGNVYKTRGSIGPSIPAVHASLSAPLDVEPMTTTNIVGWSAEYDQFGMMDENGEGFTVPEWASHVRVTASVFSMHLSPDERLNVCIGMNGQPLVCGHSPGADQTLFPTVGLKTGIIPVTDGTRFTVSAWHNGDSVKKVVNGASTFISIELFEEI